MGTTIRCTCGAVSVDIKLDESSLADELANALPISARVSTWGDEVYFSVPRFVSGGAGKPLVQVGDVAYWEPGSALCLFFGQTPISGPGEVRPASAVIVVGRIAGDPSVLRAVRDGEQVDLVAVATV